MSKLILPKKYLSWTQIEMWSKSRDSYRKRYYVPSKSLDTDEIRFGKMISERIENGTIHELLPELVVYDKPEYRILQEIDNISLLSFIDSYDTKNNVFREYKTGKKPWTKSRVQSHDQLVFYALVLYLETGKLPEYCHLDWIHTDNKPLGTFSNAKKKEIYLTGEITPFKRIILEEEVLRLKKDIIRIANEISEDYQMFLSDI